jgi:hypothetical protein
VVARRVRKPERGRHVGGVRGHVATGGISSFPRPVCAVRDTIELDNTKLVECFAGRTAVVASRSPAAWRVGYDGDVTVVW